MTARLQLVRHAAHAHGRRPGRPADRRRDVRRARRRPFRDLAHRPRQMRSRPAGQWHAGALRFGRSFRRRSRWRRDPEGPQRNRPVSGHSHATRWGRSRARKFSTPQRPITGAPPGRPGLFLNASLALKGRLSQELPRDAIGLAINAASRRSQDQLHIHVDCVAPDVRAALGAYRDRLGADWHVLPFLLAGRRYWARRLDSPKTSPTRRRSGCSPKGSPARKTTWRRKRWSPSGRPSSPRIRGSSCSPITPTPAAAAMARTFSTPLARSPRRLDARCDEMRRRALARTGRASRARRSSDIDPA